MSSGIPYLGSKISLVSKSEIRYEGILYTIDTKESTVALAKVRSFGTESRPSDRPVAPRDEVYEYIIFRASDIKDLQVSEPPKHQVTLSGLPNDPAIVQHSPPVSYSMAYGQPSFGTLCGLPAFQHYAGQPGYPHISTFFPGGHVAGSRSAALPAQKRSVTMDAGVQVSGNMINEPNKLSKSEGSYDQNQSKGEEIENAEPPRRNAPMIRRQPRRPRGGNQRRPRGRGRNVGTNRNQVILRFDNDYDFEQANAEFQELENKLAKAKIDDAIEISDAGGPVDVIQNCYDKEKSFFDNISCEASQRNARFDWRQERKLNVETFGVPRSNTWMRRRRGRGAFRGRGGFRNQFATRDGNTQKTVKFEEDIEKPVEITAEDTPKIPEKESEIATVELNAFPNIEVVVEKPKEWNDSSAETKNEDWQ